MRDSCQTPLARFSIGVVACLCCFSGKALTVLNHGDGEEVRYPVVMLTGTVTGAVPGIEATNRNSIRNDRRLPGVANKGRFRVLARLVPGKNRLHVSSGTESVDLTLGYRPQTNPNIVRVIYVTDRSGNTDFQRPSDVSSDFRGRLQTAMLLMQTFTAERLHDLGFPRRTFNLEFDGKGDVVVHVMKGDLSATEYHTMDGGRLYSQLMRERNAKLPAGTARDLVIPAFTQFNPATHEVEAHTALGGGNLALFGSGDLFTWPVSLADVPRAFSNTRRVDPDRWFSDSVGRDTFWACASTTMGAALHELGHTFGLPHSKHPHDIMTRGHDRFNRFFTLVEPPHTRRKTAYEFRDNEMAMWAPVSAQALFFERGFALDDPGDLSAHPPRISLDLKHLAVVFESSAGLGFVGIQTYSKDTGTQAVWPVPINVRAPLPKRLAVSAVELGRRIGSMNVSFSTRDGTGRRYGIALRALMKGPFATRWRLAPATLAWTDTSHFPEVSPDRLKTLTAAALASPLRDAGGSFVDLIPWMPTGKTEKVSAYLARRLVAGTNMIVRIGTGSDDALRLWLDGKLIQEVLALRGSVPDAEWTEVALARGEHVLVAEVSQQFGGWGMHLRFTDQRGDPLVLHDDGTLDPLNAAGLARFRSALTGQYVTHWRIWPETMPWKDHTAFPETSTADIARIMAECASVPLSTAADGSTTVDLAKVGPDGGSTTNRAAYAYRRLLAEAPTKVRLCTGSDDALRIWLNGIEIRRVLALRGVLPDSEKTPATLRPGQNELLVEVSNAAGGWGFCLRIEAEDGTPLVLGDDGRLQRLR